jgi:ELWxxDGT repeat protein
MKRLVIVLLLMQAFLFTLSAVDSQPATSLDRFQRQAQQRDEMAAKEQRELQHSSLKRTEADAISSADINLAMVNGTEFVKTDTSQNLVLSGAVNNNGTTTSFFSKVNINLYNAGDQLIETVWTYIYGGTTAILPSGSNASGLIQGETGYFELNTGHPMDEVDHWTYSFEGSQFSNTPTQVTLVKEGPAILSDSQDYLSVRGDVRNTSTNYLSYFTKVYIAVYNAAGNMVGIDNAYISGYTYDTGITTTSTAIYPGTTRSYNWKSDIKYSHHDHHQLVLDYDEAYTTEVKPAVHVTYPNGGENFIGNSEVTITWTTQGDVPTVNVYVSRGNAYDSVASEIPNTNSFTWRVPDQSATSSKVYIQGIIAPSTYVTDYSNDFFTREPFPKINITAPTGGTFYPGQRKPIYWEAEGSLDTQVKLEYSVSGINGPWRTIAASSPNSGSFYWTIPEAYTSGQGRVRVSELNGPTSGISSSFSIKPAPSLTITSPVGGEEWHTNTSCAITWSSTGIYSGDAVVTLMNADDTPVYTIATVPFDSSPYNFTLPGYVTAGEYKVRVEMDSLSSTSGLFNVLTSDLVNANVSMVADLWPGRPSGIGSYSVSSDQPMMFLFNNKIYFSGSVSGSGFELYQYDGTNPPSMAYDFYPGTSSGNPCQWTIFGGYLYMQASSPDHYRELWKYDGTNAPTVRELVNNSDSRPGAGVVHNGKMYFGYFDTTNGYELREFDGVNQPKLVANLKYYQDTGYGGIAIVFNDKLYFKGSDDDHGFEVWEYDFTNPPQMLMDINPGSDSGYGHSEDFIIFQDKLYFFADDGTHGKELWVYDGTNPPSAVADLNPDSGNGAFMKLLIFNNKLYFSGNNGTSSGIIEYDGTNPPENIMDRYSYPGYGAPIPDDWIESIVYNNKIYFYGNVEGYGRELCVWDGVNAPKMVADINPGSKSSLIADFIILNDKLHFRANNDANGLEMWVYDGSGFINVITDKPQVTGLTTATAGGKATIIDIQEAITARGVCWSTSIHPTISDAHTTDGSGEGSFTSNITGLTGGTTYYVRAYAATASGTSYGGEYTISTGIASPVVSGRIMSGTVTAVKSATVNFSNGGGSTVTDFNGNYSQAIPFGWTGEITVSKTGYTFEPASVYMDNQTQSETVDFSASIVAPTLSLTSPNGGEVFQGGSTQTITWNQSGRVDYVTLSYSTTGFGGSFITIAQNAPASGSYQWTVPGVSSNQCIVRITSGYGSAIDNSDSVFTIQGGASLTLTSPNGGETFIAGDSHTIQWSSTGTVGDVTIERSTTGSTGTFSSIATVSNSGSYVWNIPDTPSINYYIRIRNAAGNVSDISDGPFTVLEAGTITVTSPNGGETWKRGENKTIQWSSTGTVGNVTVEYSTAGTSGTFVAIATNINNTGSYTWNVPDVASNQCVVRVSSHQYNVSDTSNSTFSIQPDQAITVTSPNGGERWLKGTQQAITWSAESITGDVLIELYKNGQLEANLTETPATNGTWTWALGDTYTDGSDYTIKISKGTVTDTSDAPFTITGKNNNYADFNQDGKTDILWRYDNTSSSGINMVWHMDGINRIGSNVWLRRLADLDWKIEGTGDFNGDGKTDILWRYYGASSSGLNMVWLMDGTTRIGSNVWLRRLPDLNWKIAGTGDFNGDGKTDILWRYYGATSSGLNMVWYMDGTTRIGTNVWLRRLIDLNWKIEGTGDFNGDGKTDILWRYYGASSSGLNMVWYMDGVTRIGTNVWLRRLIDLNWKIEGTGDFNQDGKTDILWRYYGTSSSGLNMIWYMDGVTRIGSNVWIRRLIDTHWKIKN